VPDRGGYGEERGVQDQFYFSGGTNGTRGGWVGGGVFGGWGWGGGCGWGGGGGGGGGFFLGVREDFAEMKGGR